MRSILASGVCLGLLVSACGSRSDQREYSLQGQVTAVAPDRRQATINHEEIKGFMAAMTMPYNVRDAKQLDGIAAGDLVSARLVVLSNDAYLTDVRKVGQAPLPQQPAAAETPSASSGFELLKPGEAVPDVTFTDQDARKRPFSSFEGSTVLITFIYTSCPYPTFCPLMDRHFAEIQTRLSKDPALSKRIHLVSISFDPITDTPPVLKQHGTKLHADFKRWTFLTGDRDDIDRFAARFGVSVARATDNQRDISHNLRTAIVDPAGKLVKVYVGNEWTPDQALADLAAVAQGN
jgi:protein SCO1/2